MVVPTTDATTVRDRAVFTGGKRESISLHTAFEPEGAYVVWRRCWTPDRVDSVPSAGAAGEHPDVFAATSNMVMRKRFGLKKFGLGYAYAAYFRCDCS